MNARGIIPHLRCVSVAGFLTVTHLLIRNPDTTTGSHSSPHSRYKNRGAAILRTKRAWSCLENSYLAISDSSQEATCSLLTSDFCGQDRPTCWACPALPLPKSWACKKSITLASRRPTPRIAAQLLLGHRLAWRAESSLAGNLEGTREAPPHVQNVWLLKVLGGSRSANTKPYPSRIRDIETLESPEGFLPTATPRCLTTLLIYLNQMPESF